MHHPITRLAFPRFLFAGLVAASILLLFQVESFAQTRTTINACYHDFLNFERLLDQTPSRFAWE
jgi:hypothetical protein